MTIKELSEICGDLLYRNNPIDDDAKVFFRTPKGEVYELNTGSCIIGLGKDSDVSIVFE